jgi:hypothetical protein
MYRKCPIDDIRDEAKRLKTKGYRILVDGEHFRFPRWSKKVARIYEEVDSDNPPQVYRNLLGELAIDWDRETLGHEDEERPLLG